MGRLSVGKGRTRRGFCRSPAGSLRCAALGDRAVVSNGSLMLPVRWCAAGTGTSARGSAVETVDLSTRRCREFSSLTTAGTGRGAWTLEDDLVVARGQGRSPFVARSTDWCVFASYVNQRAGRSVELAPTYRKGVEPNSVTPSFAFPLDKSPWVGHSRQPRAALDSGVEDGGPDLLPDSSHFETPDVRFMRTGHLPAASRCLRAGFNPSAGCEKSVAFGYSPRSKP